MFAYGETGSGKTHTMEYISKAFFMEMLDLKEELKANINVNFIEIDLDETDESIYDLLVPRKDQKESLKIIGFKVQNTKNVNLKTLDQLEGLLKTA